MGHNGNSYYIGIDLNDSYAMVSFFQQNMKEPETVSTVAGSEEFQIPLVLARRKSDVYAGKGKYIFLFPKEGSSHNATGSIYR